jgi:hypothetical protein
MRLLPVTHREDFAELPGPVLTAALAEINSLRENPEKGELLKPLKEHQVHRRPLTDCRVLKIPGPFEHEVRIVYRVLDNGIEIVAVGPRRGSQVYRMAMERLDSPEEKEVPRWARLGRPR